MAEDKIEADPFLSESPGTNCMLMQGYEIVRLASQEERQRLPVFPTWGYLVIQGKAQALAHSAA